MATPVSVLDQVKSLLSTTFTEFLTVFTDITLVDPTGDTFINESVRLCIPEFSLRIPWVAVEDCTITTAYEIPLPLNWTVGFSQIQGIEYPIGDVPMPSVLDPQQYDLYVTPSGNIIRTRESIPVGEAVRVTFSAYHSESDIVGSQFTIPATDYTMFAHLVASKCALRISAYYNDFPTLPNARELPESNMYSQRWARTAASLRATYESMATEVKTASGGIGGVMRLLRG